MGVLALDEGLRRIGCKIFLAVVRRKIHRTVDVGVVLQHGPLILNRPGRIIPLYPVIGSPEIVPVAGFVAKAPDNDARVVDVPVNHTLVADEVGCIVIGPVSQGLLAVTHSVRLDIGLVENIDAILVAERVPARVIRIVASTYCIDIQLFHYFDIPDHLGLGDYISAIRAEFMAVGPLDEDRLTVDEKLGVPDLNGAESEINPGALHYSLSVLRLGPEGIEGWGFGAPERRRIDLHVRPEDKIAFIILLLGLYSGLGNLSNNVSERIVNRISDPGNARSGFGKD